MSASMARLHDEHTHLLPHIEELRSAADSVGRSPIGDLRASLDRAQSFLFDHLVPHAQAEDAVLYPVVARLLGGARATATMERDHVEVLKLTHELAALSERVDSLTWVDDDLAAELRRVLYGLYAIVSLHFAKEEEVYVPILEAGLTEDEADAMFAALHDAHHVGA